MRRILLLLALLLPGMLWSDQPSVRILFVGDSITDGGWGRSGGSMQPAEERNLKDQNHLYG
ncbi:MAG: lipase, partial [Alistipes sp.]|nr:lipase [Alistipes sp.]